MQLQAVKKKG